ncbi:hypothetical protein AVEN_119947-1 [Araneus ventricosus]|uniref:Uncharacterized protein n=1 Tax=Araneus ventricosus TaxID=182803 RepID=A0A4Y2PS31_ARAVE|nr:hypothetical protein AVEN_119947-1 [Araneus ventricosus]
MLATTEAAVVRFRLRDQRVPDSNINSTEDLRCVWARCTSNLMSMVKGPAFGVKRQSGTQILRQARFSMPCSESKLSEGHG